VISGNGIAWVADSNYQAALDSDSTHTLVALDDALRRRLSLNLTLGYLTPEEEAEVLLRIAREWKPGAPVQSDDQFAVGKVVQLGQAIRRRRADGELLSVPPPSISGYLGALRLSVRLPSLPLQDVVQLTMLGNAGADDLKALPGVLSEVFGLQAGDSDELGLNAF
jgi:hypothetical protein